LCSYSEVFNGISDIIGESGFEDFNDLVDDEVFFVSSAGVGLIGDFVVMGGVLGIRQLVFILSEALLVGQNSDLGVDDVLL